MLRTGLRHFAKVDNKVVLVIYFTLRLFYASFLFINNYCHSVTQASEINKYMKNIYLISFLALQFIGPRFGNVALRISVTTQC